MERCPNCGASVRPGARFCTACGHRLMPANTAASSSSESASQTDAVSAEDGISTTLTAAAEGATTSPPSHSEVPGHTEGAADEAQSGSTAASSVGSVATGSIANTTNNVGGTSATEDDLDLDLPRHDTPAEETNHHGAPDDEGVEPVADDADLDLPSPAEEHDQTDDTEPLDAEDLDVSAFDEAQRSADTGAAEPHNADTQHEDAAGGQDDHSDGAHPHDTSATDRSSDSEKRRAITWSEQEPDLQDMTSPDGSGDGQDTSTGTTARDDVVLDTTVVGAPTWASGSNWHRDADGSPSATGEAEASRSRDESSSRVSWPSVPAAGDNEVADPAPEAPMTGPDVDWEPWGGDSSAGANPADTGSSAENDAAESENSNAGEATGTGDAEPAINRASDLLDQLRAALTAIGDEQRATEAGTSDRASAPAWDVLSHDLNDARTHAVPDDTLNLLADRAHDVAGNEWDVRVLQQFAEQRQVVLDLIHRYREQHALLERIAEANRDA